MNEYVVSPSRNFLMLLLVVAFVAIIGYLAAGAFEPAPSRAAFSYEDVRGETGLTTFHMTVAER